MQTDVTDSLRRWEVTNVAFSLLALILTILEITKLASETLTAFFMLASHMVKLTVALVNLALDVVVYMQRSDRNYSIIGLAIDCGLLQVHSFFIPSTSSHMGSNI